MRISIFFLLTLSLVQAQNFQIEGQIADVENMPLSFVTIVLQQAKDSVFVSGTSTDNQGKFELKSIPQGEYFLKATFIGYEEIYLPIAITSNKTLGKLTLKEAPEELDQIALTVQKPNIIREIDRLIFHVENTSLSNGSSMDILKRTPSVIVQQNSITVQNQPATIYINDKKVSLSAAEVQSLLESFSGTNIKSIEVITNPSAKYDADSGIIINIVSSKNIIPGYKGNVSASFTQAFFPKGRLGTSHFYKNDWLNFSIDYSFNKRKEHKNDLGKVTFFEPDNSVNSFWETDFERITHSEKHTITSAADFILSEKSNLNVSSVILFEPNTTYRNSETANIFNPQKQLDSLFTTASNLDLENHNLAFDVTFTHKFNDKGTNFSANSHYTNYSDSRFQNVNTNYFLNDGTFLRNNTFFTDANQDIDIFIGQVDFETKLLGLNMETGAKISSIDSESGIDFFDVINSTSTQNMALSDHFNYKETVFAGYMSLSKNWEKWKLRLGFRGEHTSTEGNSITLNQVNKDDYFELFPNAVLNYSPNQNNSITASFKRSIQRPNYSLLNPFSYFINENNFSTGNPDLQPAITNNFSLNYTVENKHTFQLYYRTTQGDIDVLSFQNNPNRLLRSISTNINEKIGYGFDFSNYSYIRNWWSLSQDLSLFHEENSFFAIESDNEFVTIESDGFYIRLLNSFNISKDRTFTADLSLTYLSGIVIGTYLMDEFTIVSIGARKSLWNNRASLSLTVNDLFDTTDRKLQTDYLNQRNSYFAQTESQFIQLGFVYNFGNFRLSNNPTQINKEERDRINKAP